MIKVRPYTGKLYSPSIKVPQFEKLRNELYMRAEVYHASDYAGFSSANLSVYYGYEKTNDEGEWCFEAKFADQVVVIPFSKLKCDDQFNCVDCLMKGVAWLFEKYKVSF